MPFPPEATKQQLRRGQAMNADPSEDPTAAVADTDSTPSSRENTARIRTVLVDGYAYEVKRGANLLLDGGLVWWNEDDSTSISHAASAQPATAMVAVDQEGSHGSPGGPGWVAHPNGNHLVDPSTGLMRIVPGRGAAMSPARRPQCGRRRPGGRGDPGEGQGGDPLGQQARVRGVLRQLRQAAGQGAPGVCLAGGPRPLTPDGEVRPAAELEIKLLESGQRREQQAGPGADLLRQAQVAPGGDRAGQRPPRGGHGARRRPAGRPRGRPGRTGADLGPDGPPGAHFEDRLSSRDRRLDGRR